MLKTIVFLCLAVAPNIQAKEAASKVDCTPKKQSSFADKVNQVKKNLDSKACEGTSARAACYRRSAQRLDVSLNGIYKSLGGAKNTKLYAAQKAWLSFRDLEIKFQASLVDLMGPGTQAGLTMARKNFDLMLTRVQQLQKHLSFRCAHE